MKLNLRSVDLNLLVVFDAIMEFHSLTAAAEHLAMSQPAVSNALARLRHLFGDELFVRVRHGMVPTERAKELAEKLEEALEIIQYAVEKEPYFDPANSDRRFRLALNRMAETTLLPRLLPNIEQLGSEISIETHPFPDAKVLEKVVQGKIDFYFDYKRPEDDRLACQLISESIPVVIAASNHPRLANTISAKQFMEEKHIVINFYYDDKSILETVLTQKIEQRKILASVTQVDSLPQIVAETEAIAVLPSQIARHFAKVLPIRVYKLPFRSRKFPYYLVWSKSREGDKGHQWLKAQILNA